MVPPIYPEKPKLNKTGTVFSLASVLSKTVGRAVDSPFRSKEKKARTYRRDVLYKLLRHLVSDFDAHQGQWVLPGTDAIYKYTSRRKKWKRNTVELEHGAKGHWLGHSDAKYVLLFFHGGGYVAPSTPGHMKYQFALQKYLRKQGLDVSVLSLSYMLAPKAVHPAFIKQGLSALRYLVDKDRRDPGSIIVAGDSAGGNMVASLLLHLGRPHPDCDEYKLETKLRGALLISPWVSFDTNTASVTQNRHSDYITKKALEYGRVTFIPPGSKHDNYSHPVDAPVDWWKSVAEKVVDKVLIWGGGGEILVDGIKQFAHNVMSGFEDAEDVLEQKNELLKMMTADVEKLHPEVHLRAKMIVSPDEAHEEMIINHLFYIKKEDDGGKQIKKWLVETLTHEPEVTVLVKPDDGQTMAQKSEGTKSANPTDEETLDHPQEAIKLTELDNDRISEAEEPLPKQEFQGVTDTKETIEQAKDNQEKLDSGEQDTKVT